MCFKRNSICKGQGFLVDFYETCLQLEREQDFKIPRIKEYLSVRLEGLIRGFQDPSKEEEKKRRRKEQQQQQEERAGAEEVVEVNPFLLRAKLRIHYTFYRRWYLCLDR